MVLRVEGGAISKRANRPFAGGVWAGIYKMSNAWVVFEMEGGGRTNQMRESERERVAARGGGEREKVRRVLDPDRNPRTLVVIIHEEAINQFPGWLF
jgi:hypothetical protein